MLEALVQNRPHASTGVQSNSLVKLYVSLQVYKVVAGVLSFPTPFSVPSVSMGNAVGHSRELKLPV